MFIHLGIWETACPVTTTMPLSSTLLSIYPIPVSLHAALFNLLWFKLPHLRVNQIKRNYYQCILTVMYCVNFRLPIIVNLFIKILLQLQVYKSITWQFYSDLIMSQFNIFNRTITHLVCLCSSYQSLIFSKFKEYLNYHNY
ncbi:hypothetical protein BC833DRAFT_102836 [Globomyces pollinis-pini]|nr:hypothetical protein BC833DRAFT_102836 [Globomyces pollinis-pini]